MDKKRWVMGVSVGKDQMGRYHVIFLRTDEAMRAAADEIGARLYP